MTRNINSKALQRFAAGVLALVMAIMLFPTTAHATYDNGAASSLKLSFIQVQPNQITHQLTLSDSLQYRTPYLGKVIAHVMDVRGDDGQTGVGFCGNHAKALSTSQVNSDVWNYAGVWTPGGSIPFLNYYYTKNYESDMIRAEAPGQTDQWYENALNSYEWGYVHYLKPADRYAMNTWVQIVVWLDRSGQLGAIPAACDVFNNWAGVKQTNWYKVLLKEYKSYCKAFGITYSSASADDLFRTVLMMHYSEDYGTDIEMFEYVHSEKPDYYQPLLVMWYK